jgi:MoxR-like ATPase
MSRVRGNCRFSHYDRVELEGKMVWVPRPAEIPTFTLVEREDLQNRSLAAWWKMDDLPPLNFRLYGPPGSGKNAMVYRLAQLLKKDLYIITGHQELGPEDIACSATMTARRTIEYVASPLFAALWRGGICFFDEIGKAPTSALDPLASVLDDRRTLTSVLAGIHLQAHPDFLFCAALNQNEEEGLGLPGFIDERTRPAIQVGYPSLQTVELILRAHVPMASDVWFRIFLQQFPEELSPRGAIVLLSYAFRLSQLEENQRPTRHQIKGYLKQAAESVAVDKKRPGEN